MHDLQGRVLTYNSAKWRRYQGCSNQSSKHQNYLDYRAIDIAMGSLTCPISEIVVENASHRLNNNHACKPVRIAGEMWKYSAGMVSVTLASIFNQALEEGQPLDLGSRCLIPLQKPGKPLGPLPSGPIAILSTICKALLLIVLCRVADSINNYLDPRFRL